MAQFKSGDKISIGKFFVSKMNIRFGEKFGLAEEDDLLAQNLVKGSLVQPIIARPEADGFGVVIGRRRFLAKKRARATHLIVGSEVLIKDLSDEEALDDSLRENLDTFRSSLNPVVRAKALKKLMETKKMSLRDLANVWRIPPANVSDWMQVLKLSQRMQKAVAAGNILFTDALRLARMNLPDDKQRELAEIAEKEYADFKAEFARLLSGREKRGIPEGKYEILRVAFDKNNAEELELYQRFVQLAKVTNQSPIEFLKSILTEFMEKGRLKEDSKEEVKDSND